MTVTFKDILEFLKRFPVGMVCVLLSVIVLGCFFLRRSRVDELSTQSRQMEEQGRIVLAELRDATGLPEHCASLSAKTRDLESRLVRASERAHNQQYFYRIESDTGVREISLQAGSGGAGPRKGERRLYSGIGYTVTVVGNYRQIIDFIGRFEGGPRFFRLNSASVSRQGDRNSAGPASPVSLTLNLELLGMP
jgi:Tfp pilus assembly protein PilO